MRNSFSGAMPGRPPLMSAAYIPVSSGSMFLSAKLTIRRTERRGWFWGTKSSRPRMMNKLSVKVSAARMVW